MLRTIIVVTLVGFALSACASTRAADLSTPQSKPKAVQVVKAKPKAAPAVIAPQPAAPAPKAKKTKKHWWQVWRKKSG